MKINNIKWLLLPALFTLFLFSCKKDFNPDFELPRQFKPGDISVAAGEIEAHLRWNSSLFTQGKDVTYTVEVYDNAAFEGTAVFSEVVDTNAVVVTDAVLEINKDYYARVKANALGNTAESGWVAATEPFRITGEQIFSAVNDAELTDSSVILRWRPSAGLTRIVLTPAGGTATEIQVTADDIAANQKYITGLTQLTNYTAEIYRGSLKKGTVSFTTKEKSIFSRILEPGDDLAAAVEAAADGDIIGLQPGTYDVRDAVGYEDIVVEGKTITIQSFSGNPRDTKVNFQEIEISGTGAGIILKGIEFDGAPGDADYFINFTGAGSDSAPADFTQVTVDNCIVHHTNNAFMRGNRGGNNAHKINSITVNNTIAYANGTGSYHYFMLDKMEFKTLEITNSTLYDIARAIISWATNLTVATTPQITIDHSTINSFGFSGRNNIILDANNNVVNFTFQNSIIANTPKPGQEVGTSAMRANSGSTISFSNNNYFKLTGGNPAETLVFPSYVQMSNNQTLDLGWDAATTDFSLPADSPLRTASTTNGPIGDPRWH